jgi:uncharacterized protein
VNIFIDTVAFLAVLNADDRFHRVAKDVWNKILSSEDSSLCSSNYVILETTALLQHRFGLFAVRLFETDLLPIIATIWVNEATHKQAMSALLVANRRDLSLVDCTSFEIIRQVGIESIFTFDLHFREQGFQIIPESDL